MVLCEALKARIWLYWFIILFLRTFGFVFHCFQFQIELQALKYELRVPYFARTCILLPSFSIDSHYGDFVKLVIAQLSGVPFARSQLIFGVSAPRKRDSFSRVLPAHSVSDPQAKLCWGSSEWSSDKPKRQCWMRKWTGPCRSFGACKSYSFSWGPGRQVWIVIFYFI